MSVPRGLSKARVGFPNNNNNDCHSCDSRIEFGTGEYPDDSTTCGNAAQHSADNGDKFIKSMGYILVQENKIAQKTTLTYLKFKLLTGSQHAEDTDWVTGFFADQLSRGMVQRRL